jgi:hypothetical protein
VAQGFASRFIVLESVLFQLAAYFLYWTIDERENEQDRKILFGNKRT